MAPALSSPLTSFQADAAPRPPTLAPVLATAFVVVWTLWAIGFNSAQFGDNMEQFNWSHSLEWGYHKHPPLPTWLLGGLIRLFGYQVHLAHAPAAACLVGTAWLTWAIGRALWGERVACAGVLLWGLHMYFSSRAQLYNHNTVLVLGIAFTVWCALRATQHGRWWWLLTGLGAGASMLSKYQALLPLSGLLAGLILTQRVRTRTQWQGLGFALGVALLCLVPNVMWLIEHRFSSFDYAAEAVQAGGPLQRFKFIGSFLANQLRTTFPMVAAIGIAVFLTRRVGVGRRSERLAAARDERVWFWCLLGWPLAVLMTLGLVGSVSLRNHWGMQSMQFFGLWLAWMWHRRAPIDWGRLVLAAALVHAVSLGVYAAQQRAGLPTASARRIDTLYPAQRLADAAVAQWRSVTTCPLHYVAGDAFTAGLVSVYSGSFPAVFESPRASPWITAADLQRDGALYVLPADKPLPDGAVAAAVFDIGERPLKAPSLVPRSRHLSLVVVAPARACR